MTAANILIEAIRDAVDYDRPEKSQAVSQPLLRMANIDPAYVAGSGRPSVVFGDEAVTSPNVYPILDVSYSPVAGDPVVMILVGNKQYCILGPIIPASAMDTGYMTQATNPGIITALGTNTVVGYVIRKVGAMAYFYVTFTIGTTLTVPADGNVANVNMAQINTSAFIPTMPSGTAMPLVGGASGVTVTGYINNAGVIVLSSTVPGSSFAAGTSFVLTGVILV